jgi:hypothetical protein
MIMERKCPYHNRILVKKVVQEKVMPISFATRDVVYRVCPVSGCGYKIKSDEEP